MVNSRSSCLILKLMFLTTSWTNWTCNERYICFIFFYRWNFIFFYFIRYLQIMLKVSTIYMTSSPRGVMYLYVYVCLCKPVCVLFMSAAHRVSFSTWVSERSLTTTNQRRTEIRSLSPSSISLTAITETWYSFYWMGWVNRQKLIRQNRQK